MGLVVRVKTTQRCHPINSNTFFMSKKGTLLTKVFLEWESEIFRSCVIQFRKFAQPGREKAEHPRYTSLAMVYKLLKLYLVSPDLRWAVDQRCQAAEVPNHEVLFVALAKVLNADQVRVADSTAVRQTVFALILWDVIQHSLQDDVCVPWVAKHVVVVHKWEEPRRACVVLAQVFKQHSLGIAQSTLHGAIGVRVVLVKRNEIILILKDAAALLWGDISVKQWN